MTGALSVRRFRVVGDLPEGFRDRFREGLQENAFKEPLTDAGKEETEGWVLTQNFLDHDFTDFTRWLFEPSYVLFALRVDKKSLPGRLVKAMLQKRCEAWAEERGVQRCPASVRTDLLDDLEYELLKKILPRAAVTEACWHLDQQFLLLHASSDSVVDRFRKRFFNSFGMRLVPWSPLDWLGDGPAVEKMMNSAPSFLAMETE
ncbi:MAG: recombination associated protein RdgC [Myxococcota bacterium]|jgi:DNA recombination-dependent growth factor C